MSASAQTMLSEEECWVSMISAVSMTVVCSSYEHRLILTSAFYRLPTREKATLMLSRSRRWQLMDYVLVRRRHRQDLMANKAIPGADGWTDHRLVIFKIRLSLQPRRRPQATVARNAGHLDGSQGRGDLEICHCYKAKNFFVEIKTIYGFQKKETDKSILLTEELQILTIWTEHFRGIHNRPSTVSNVAIDRLPEVEINTGLDLPPPLPGTIRIVQQLSRRKASGSDAIPAEVHKNCDHRLLDRLTALFQEKWHCGQVPQDFKDATIVCLYKRKGNQQLCDSPRGISPLNIARKIFVRTLLSRLNDHPEQGFLPGSQCDFRRQRAPLTCCLAPASYKRSARRCGLTSTPPGILRRPSTWTGGHLLNSRRIQTPMRLNATTIHGLLFADNCALNSTTEEDMQWSMDHVVSDCAHFGLTINTDKTVIMRQRASTAAYCIPGIRANGIELKIVDSFNYAPSESTTK
ncbi:hypothetical protein SprV_0301256400 [Sparganum proliferum]